MRCTIGLATPAETGGMQRRDADPLRMFSRWAARLLATPGSVSGAHGHAWPSLGTPLDG